MVLKRYSDFNITCNNMKDLALIICRLSMVRDMYFESDENFYNKMIEKSIPILENKYNCTIKRVA